MARKLLLEQGVGVSTRRIAAAVGVSEGVLFQRFGTKAGLVRAALAAPVFDADRLIQDAAGHRDPARAFEDVLVAILGAFRRSAPATLPRLQRSAAGRSAFESADEPFQALRAALERHLTRERGRGRFAAHPPADAAWLLTSSLHHAALVEVVSGPSPSTSELVVRRLARALWSGYAPRPSPTAS